jgi:hypothetical protein
MCVLDVVVTHPAAQTYFKGAAKEAGYAAARAAHAKRVAFGNLADGTQYEFVPFAVESYGRLGAAAMGFLSSLGDAASEGGRVSKSAFVQNALRAVSVAVQRGNGAMYSRSVQEVARACGRRFLPGCDAPVPDPDDL